MSESLCTTEELCGFGASAFEIMEDAHLSSSNVSRNATTDASRRRGGNASLANVEEIVVIEKRWP
jgi:hypothetical protein